MEAYMLPQALKELLVGNNALTQLPPDFAQLKTLTLLHIGGNPQLTPDKVPPAVRPALIGTHTQASTLSFSHTNAQLRKEAQDPQKANAGGPNVTQGALTVGGEGGQERGNYVTLVTGVKVSMGKERGRGE